MPNWCENKLVIHGNAEQLESIKSKLLSTTEDNESRLCVDFNLLIPMPDELNIESGSRGNHAKKFLEIPSKTPLTLPIIEKYIHKAEVERIATKAKELKWTVGDFIEWLIDNPKEQDILGLGINLGLQYINNLIKYGYPDWYDWRCNNWGCKWNVSADTCSVFINDDCIECLFDTPWGPPVNWFTQLCSTFPNIEMTLSYYEPGMYFAGELSADMNGSYTYTEVPEENFNGFVRDVFEVEFDDEEGPVFPLVKA